MTTLMSDETFQTYVDQDGYLVDTATGEVLGIADVHKHLESGLFGPTWHVDSEDTAEWVLERRARLEADIAGLEAREKAIRDNIRAQIAEKTRRLAYLDFRFRPSLIEWARERLAGGKRRTLQLTHGKIAFRTGRETHRIVDMADAVAWMRHADPNQIKIVESVTATAVLAAEKSHGIHAPSVWFQTEPARESVTIETGVSS